MVFLIRDNYILAHGTKWDDDNIIKMFRDEVEVILSTSCTVYIDERPINDTPSKTILEKVDELVYYLHKGTNVFTFKWNGIPSESVIHLQAYSI